MSQALCLVDRATHVGSFRCVPYERRRCRVHYRPIFAWPWHRAVLAVFVHCALLLFLASSRLSTLTPRPSYRTPLPSPFLLLLVTRPPARLPRRADALSSPLFPPLPLAQEAHHVSDLISTACTVCVSHPRRNRLRCVVFFSSPFTSINTLGPCSSSSFPFPHIRSTTMRSSRRCEARFRWQR